MNAETVEWCVIHPSHPNEIHRGPMSEEAARAWVTDPDFRPGLFRVGRRVVGAWEIVDEGEGR